jgi:uncharacterized delta-60 repeat protein
MKIILSTVFLIIVFAANLFAQGAVIRVLTYNGPGNGVDEVTGMAMDHLGNVYVTGYSKGNGTDEDFATIKFNNNGDFLWVNRFNGTGNYTDRAVGITVDNAGNVYVTGWAHMEPQGNNDEILCGTIDYVTIKYDAYGVQQWMKIYAGSAGGDDIPSAITLDSYGNVYVTGTSYGGTNKEDYLTIKYDNGGVQKWVARYDGTSHNVDNANAIAVDRSGFVYVTGNSYKSGSGADYVTVKYNNNGQLQWTKNYNGPANSDDKAYSIATDPDGSAFVTGTSRGSSSNFDYATLKYGPDGSVLWLKRYNGPGNGVDEAHSIILDPYGNTYITGFSLGSGTGYDYATIRYDANGNELWVKRFNGQYNGTDKAWDVKIIKRLCPENLDYPCWKFEVYVTGQSQGNGTGYDFLTVKYDEYGNVIWTSRYQSSGNIDDISTVLTVRDEFGYLFAGGRINNNYGILQIANRLSGLDNHENYVLGNNIPDNFNLAQNYPNPFNPSTVISYDLPVNSFVDAAVYDLLGKKISTLVNEYQSAGRYNVTFNPASLPSGTYIYTIKAGNYTSSKKMVLIK